MTNFIIPVVLILAFSLVSAHTDATCQFGGKGLSHALLQCLDIDGALTSQVLKFIQNPKSTDIWDLICQNREGVTDILLCIEDKLTFCYPDSKFVTQLLPIQAILEDSLQAGCDDKEEIVNKLEKCAHAFKNSTAEILEHKTELDLIEVYDFLCKNKKNLVDIFVCSKDVFETHFPSYEILKQYLPNHELLGAVLHLICDFTCLDNQERAKKGLSEDESEDATMVSQFRSFKKDPSVMALLDFLCWNKNALDRNLMCWEDRFISFFLTNHNIKMQHLPTEKRWDNSLTLTCILRENLQCKLNKKEIEKIIDGCSRKEPYLKRFIQNLDYHVKPLLDFTCRNKNIMIQFLVCVRDEITDCFPSYEGVIKHVIFKELHIAYILRFLCENKAEALYYLSPSDRMQVLLEDCDYEDTSLMLQALDHLDNSDFRVSSNFVCKYRDNLVDVILCMQDKLTSFRRYRILHQNLPDEDRWNDALDIICGPKKDFPDEGCVNQMYEFTNCYFHKITVGVGIQGLEETLCSIRSDEECIKNPNDACAKHFLDVFVKAMDTLVPYCLATEVNKKTAKDAKTSVNDQQLKFRPKGGS